MLNKITKYNNIKKVLKPVSKMAFLIEFQNVLTNRHMQSKIYEIVPNNNYVTINKLKI